MSGKINRLLERYQDDNWDGLIPDEFSVLENCCVITFRSDPSRLGLLSSRFTLINRCCGFIRDEGCGDLERSSAVLTIVHEVLNTSRTFTPARWNKPSQTFAIIDYDFEVIERPFRFYSSKCSNRLDTRSEWLDFWGMVNRWFDLSVTTSGDLNDLPFWSSESIASPPLVCTRISELRQNVTSTYLIP